MKNSHCFLGISYSKHKTCVSFVVLFHTFVQKPLHKPDLHISNSFTTRNDLDMFLQGIASNASCPNGNLDPMRVVVGNLRIFPGRHRP